MYIQYSTISYRHIYHFEDVVCSDFDLGFHLLRCDAMRCDCFQNLGTGLAHTYTEYIYRS